MTQRNNGIIHSQQPRLAVVCSKCDAYFVYRNLIIEQASMNHASIIWKGSDSDLRTTVHVHTRLMKPRTTDVIQQVNFWRKIPSIHYLAELRTDLSMKYRSKPQPLPRIATWSACPGSIKLPVPSTWSTSTLSAHRSSVGSEHNQKTLNNVV